MRAIDTNVAARYLLNDDPAQAVTAQRVIEAGVYLSPTVLLELGWLLRSRYGFDRLAIANMLIHLVDLPTVSVPTQTILRWAIARHGVTGDLADLLHLAGAGLSDAFVTFDAGIRKAAGAHTPIPIETLA